MKAAEFSGAIYTEEGREDQRTGEVRESHMLPKDPREMVTRWWTMTLPPAEPPPGSAVRASHRAWLTAYTGQVSLKDRIFASLTRHMLPGHVPFVPEPYSQTELAGEAWEAFTCWMTSCAVLTRGALMTVRGCSGNVSTWTKKLSSSELRSISLSSCAVLFFQVLC